MWEPISEGCRPLTDGKLAVSNGRGTGAANEKIPQVTLLLDLLKEALYDDVCRTIFMRHYRVHN